MDHPLLKRLAVTPAQAGVQEFQQRSKWFWIPAFAGMTIALIFAGCLFEDPSEELDPALNDSTLVSLSATEHFPVPRRHILESFGSFGCVSCPGAEEKLLPYIHPELNSSGYDSNLVVVNYHVKFGSIKDPWVTAATQARYDQSFSNSLPQVTLDGANRPFGIRETDVEYDQGQYDSLVYRLKTRDRFTFLDLVLDTANLVYDSATRKLNIHFTVFNRDTVSRGPLSFRVLAVKNLSVKFPMYPKPWETIVAETTDKDTLGQSLVTAGMPGLKAKSFGVALSLVPESLKNPAPANPENPADYAVILIAKDGQGVVQNVFSFKYKPQ